MKELEIFTGDTGEFRIPRNSVLDLEYHSTTDLENAVREKAVKYGLLIEVDYDIDVMEHIIRWRPDPNAQ